jgi:hypothetical protein
LNDSAGKNGASPIGDYQREEVGTRDAASTELTKAHLQVYKEFLLMKSRLHELILDHAFQYSDTPTFKLASGGLSQFYFNCKKVTLDPEG